MHRRHRFQRFHHHALISVWILQLLLGSCSAFTTPSLFSSRRRNPSCPSTDSDVGLATSRRSTARGPIAISRTRLGRISGPCGTSLFVGGISEWRNSSINKNRSILLFPLSSSLLEEEKEVLLPQLLLPGQTTILDINKISRSSSQQRRCLLQTLESAVQLYSGVIGGIIKTERGDGGGGEKEDDEFLSTLPLFEIKQFSAEEGTVTLKCMGRAQLVADSLSRQQQSKSTNYLKGICYEIRDESIEDDKHKKICDELVEDIEQMLAANSGTYQQTFLVALVALGYNPASLLSNPSKKPYCQQQKEIEAASWAGVAAAAAATCGRLESSETQRSISYNDFYQEAFATTSTMKRLQLIRRHVLMQSLDRAENRASMGKATGLTEGEESGLTSRSIGMIDGMDDDMMTYGMGSFQ